jgi:anti-sigma factor RsiW
MNGKHVTHLLPAYVHQQMNARQRDQVRRHLRECPACRAALTREESLVRDLRQMMPGIGEPAPGQLRRLWPAVRAEVQTAPPAVRLIPSLSVLVMMMLICAFSISALFGDGTTHAIAAPNQRVPADIQATNTPFHTEEPRDEAATALIPSQTASALELPKPSPAPLPVQRYPGG